MAIKLGDLVMNINKFTGGLDNHARTRNEPAKAPVTPQSQAAEKDSGAFTDQVKLSASSKSIQQIEAEVRNLPEVDDSTVERIRSQIENGEYKVDYQKLAGKMLDFEERLN